MEERLDGPGLNLHTSHTTQRGPGWGRRDSTLDVYKQTLVPTSWPLPVTVLKQQVPPRIPSDLVTCDGPAQPQQK